MYDDVDERFDEQQHRTPHPEHLPKPEPPVLDLLVRRAKQDKSGNVVPGKPVKNTLNLQIILENDSRQAGRFMFDEWTEEALVVEGEGLRPLRDDDMEGLRQWVSAAYGLDYNKQDVAGCVDYACRQNVLTELTTWLEELRWDGVPRVHRVWIDYFGCEESQVAEVYGRKWMIQAAARALSPGCMAQAMVVLQGAQGKGKTTGVMALAGRTERGVELSADLPTDRSVNDRESLMQLRAGWIVNVDELEALNKSSIAAVKSWLTAKRDTYRSPYAMRAESHDRHCVLIGSTNMSTFLHDSTGSRRFWAMTIARDRHVDVAAITRDRAQLWAEAVHLYRSGEQWHLTPDEEDLRAEANKQYESEGWREDEIEEYIATQTSGKVVVASLVRWLDLRRSVGDENKATARVRSQLERMGYVFSGAVKAKVDGRVTRYYYRPT